MVDSGNIVVPGGKLLCFKKIVKIVVGPNDDGHTLIVHEDILTADSAFFKAALSKAWVEGQDELIKLPNDDPDVLQFYLQFLYTGKIPMKNENETIGLVEDILCDIFVFAEKVQNVIVKNAAIKGLIENLNSSNNETTNTLYLPQDDNNDEYLGR